tara:strand:- start:1513 stop:2694 length:1182 start_codon:yes stop_codon:yes gene_type:complete
LRALVAIFSGFLSAAFLADWLSGNPGHIVIYFDGNEFRMTLAFGIVVLAITFVVGVVFLSVLQGLLRFPSKYKRARQWQSREKFVEGFLADVLGNSSVAERLYLSGAKYGASADAHYLAAAKVAHKRRDMDRRNELLQSAIKIGGKDSLASVKRAQWLLEEGDFDKAELVISELPLSLREEPSVLRLLGEIFFQQKEFDKLITLLPTLISRKAFDKARLKKIQISSYSGYLLKRAQTGQLEEINKAWKNIPRKVKMINQVFATYAGLLIEKEEYGVAERLLRKKIEAGWDPQLVALYGEIRPTESRKILKNLEKWGREHPKDIGLGIARARQFMQAGMWGQARGVVSHLVKQEPTPKMYKLLADIDERLGDSNRSSNNRKAGLELAANFTIDQ